MRIKIIFAMLLVTCLCMIPAAPSAFAADGDTYTYTIKIYAGAQGEIKGESELVESGFEYDDPKHFTADINDVTVTNPKYYARGFRLTGHDNDENEESPAYTTLDFAVTEDQSYEVAYGLKGALVAYTVNYVNENGTALTASGTYYGMPGDKAIVASKFIDGYLPSEYSQGMILSEDPASNVFTFTYREATPEEIERVIHQQAPGTVTTAAGGAAAGAGAGAAAGTATIGDGQTPLAGPQQYTDVDDSDTPLSNPFIKDWKDWLAVIGGGIAGLIFLLLLILYLLRRRKAGEEEIEEAIEEIDDDEL